MNRTTLIYTFWHKTDDNLFLNKTYPTYTPPHHRKEGIMWALHPLKPVSFHDETAGESTGFTNVFMKLLPGMTLLWITQLLTPLFINVKQRWNSYFLLSFSFEIQIIVYKQRQNGNKFTILCILGKILPKYTFSSQIN